MKTLIGFVAALAREAWAMEPSKLEAFLQRIASCGENLGVGPATGQFATRPMLINGDVTVAGASTADEDGAPMAGLFDDAPPRSRMAVANGVATIPISGVLMKSVPKIFRWFGIDATSYQEIQDDLAKANGDAGVTSILLAIDSPGGQVAGVKETADAIAASSKPVAAQISDLGASGAYWLAAQAKQIAALPNALVGSIGVYTSYTDTSKMAEDLGIKVHVVSSGPHKGMGVPGAKITPEQLAAAQEVIDGMAANFVADVARGRRRSTEDCQGWATGRVWLAKDAKTMGLIDQVMNENSKGAAGGRPAAEIVKPESKEETMDPVQQERKRSADIKAAFPRHPQFALEHIEKGSTLAEAQVAFNAVLEAELLASQTARADAEKKIEAASKSGKPAAGAPPVPVGANPASAQGSVHPFMALVEERMKQNGGNRIEAMSYCCARNRQLYREWEAAADAKALARAEGVAAQ